MKLGEIAKTLGLTLHGGDLEIKGVAQIESAGGVEIAFLADKKASALLSSSKAGAFILPEGVLVDRPFITAKVPLLTFAKVMELLHPERRPEPIIHPSSVIADDVHLGDSVHVGPFVAIGAGSKIADNVVLRAGAKIGESCTIGEGSEIFENVVIYDKTEVGARVRIHANTTIGSDGFGYVRDGLGERQKIPQIGSVLIEDDVEIGANSSIDRASMGKTILKRGVKLDNQVQIGHNVVVGEDVVMAGCSGIAGSATVGANVMIGGMVAIADHVTIAPGVMIAGKTGVHSDIKEPGIYAGPMAMKNFEYKRFLLVGKKVAKLASQVNLLKEKLGLK